MKCKTKSRKKRDLTKASRVSLPEDYPWKLAAGLLHDLSYLLTDSEKNQVEGIIRNRDVSGYLELSELWGLQSINLHNADTLPVVRGKYQLAALLKNYQFEGSEADKRIAAVMKFIAAEAQCHRANKKFNSLDRPDEAMSLVTSEARKFLRNLLGEFIPGGHVLTDKSRHGPGATLDTCKGQTSSYFKYDGWPYSCTVGAYRYARWLIETDQRWLGALQDSYRERYGIAKQFPLDLKLFWSRVIRIVDANRISFVPKNAKTLRSIAIEPTLNLMLQLGVDGFIRGRLKRYGVDLDSQQKNQELARLGSIDGSYTTIDLSAASDTISLGVCRTLLPPDWYRYLLDLRSPYGELGGERISYEKLSSMGNGYTFVVESAIFAAICVAVMKIQTGAFHRKDIAVYGDDLIVPTPLYQPVRDALAYFGFTINEEKTFSKGPIRESCGTDWFRGQPLRPVFLDTLPKTVPDLFVDRNRLKRILELRWEITESRTVSKLDGWIPEAFRCFVGPYSDEEFDSYIHCHLPHGRYRNWMWKFRRLSFRPLPQRARNFLMRKLMHNLRQSPPVPQWDRRKRGKSERFTATKREAYAVGQSYSVADTWRSTYGE